MPDRYDAVLVTRDAALRAAVLARRPAGARVLCVDPHEIDDCATIETDRWWIDLDCPGPLPRPPRGQCSYFCNDLQHAPRSLRADVLVRTGPGEDFPALLWSHLRPTAGDAGPPGLPGWTLDLHELDLAQLLRALIAQLPQRLGYEEILVYLHDAQVGTLRLGKTNVRSDVMLEVPVDGPALLATAVRRQQIVVDGRPLAGEVPLAETPAGDEAILTLTRTAELVGCVHLRRHRRPRTPLSDAQLLLLTRLLGRLLGNAQAHERVRNEARIDALTGLYNQRWMQEALGREILRAQRYGSPLSVVMLDLDALKRTNDLWGHRVGDDLLRHTATRIAAGLRQIDAAARTGGDEFVVLLPRTDLAGALPVADRMQNTLRDDPPQHAGQFLSARASIGVAQWRPGQDTLQLLDAADAAMYRAKQAGGDRVSSEPLPERSAADCRDELRDTAVRLRR